MEYTDGEPGPSEPNLRLPLRDHCCQNFSLVDAWLDERGLQQRGKVGYADARLIHSGDIVEVVTERLKENENTFLHPLGVDEECDDAWRSLAD